MEDIRTAILGLLEILQVNSTLIDVKDGKIQLVMRAVLCLLILTSLTVHLVTAVECTPLFSSVLQPLLYVVKP